MHQGNAVRRHRKVINVRLVDVVRAVDPDDGGQQGPCPEKARGVRGYSCRGVELARVGWRDEGLGGVDEGDEGDLVV